MKRLLIWLLIVWLCVCAFIIYGREKEAVQGAFMNLIDDNKLLEIDFSRPISFLKKLKIINKEVNLVPITIPLNVLLRYVIPAFSFFFLGNILIAIFKTFNRFIFYPTLIMGGIIIFWLHYGLSLALSERFNWIYFGRDYLSLGLSVILGKLKSL